MVAQGICHGDSHVSCQSFLLPQLSPQLRCQLVHLVGVAQYLSALVRQIHSMANPLKKADAQLLFYLADLERHRGLGIPQTGRRPGKTALLRHK